MNLTESDPWWVTWLESGSLEGTQELAFGLKRLKQALGGSGYQQLDLSNQRTWPPSDRWVILLAHPALIATRFARQALIDMTRSQEDIALIPSQNTRFGQAAANYATGYHLERYIDCMATMQARREGEDQSGSNKNHISRHEGSGSLGGIAGLFIRAGSFELVRRKLQANAGHDPLSLMLSKDIEVQDARLLIRAYCHDYGNYQAEDRSPLTSMIPSDIESLVDIGGGQGCFAAQVAKSRNIKVAVCEPSPLAASLARAKGLMVFEQNFPERVGAKAPWAPGCFQMVSMLDVLEHASDPLALLCAVRRALTVIDQEGSPSQQGFPSARARSAYLLLSVPNAGFWQCIEATIAGRFSYEPVGPWCITHRYHFTRQSLQELLQQAGFKVCEWNNEEQTIDQRFLEAIRASGLSFDEQSMKIISFHVLARTED